MEHALNIPIPSDRKIEGWKNVIIEECGETAVLLNSYAPDYIVADSQYFAQKIDGAKVEIYCRADVAIRLLNAAQQLPTGYKFLVWDAWRPVEVQQALFDAHKAQLKKQMQNASEEELIETTQKYVSVPSVNELRPSPHLTGGAIDLTIIDNQGQQLDMGTPFDHFGPEAQTDFYELKDSLTAEESIILYNRRLLYNAMVSAGFSNYPHEWWHFDYGNQFWGKLTDNKAIYSLVFI